MSTQGKGYLRPMEATWWLHNKQLMLFMLRELTSVFVAGYAIYLLFLLGYRNNPAKFAELARSPGAIFFQIIALPFLVFHSVTWFNLTPKAIVLFRGDERVNPLLISGAHYALWVLVSLFILWIAL